MGGNELVVRQVDVFGAATGREELEALTPSVLGGWMGMGPRVREFEVEFRKRLGLDFAMTDSGSNALHLAVRALELPPGEIVLPSFTWVACANAVVLAGHRPVFADVDLASANVDAETIARASTDRTRAVLVVHYAGRTAEIGPIVELGLPVIEDAATPWTPPSTAGPAGRSGTSPCSASMRSRTSRLRTAAGSPHATWTSWRRCAG